MDIREELPTILPIARLSGLMQRDGFQIAAGLLPVVLFGAGLDLADLQQPEMLSLGTGMVVAGCISILVGVVLGWFSGFPRWSMSYVVPLILAASLAALQDAASMSKMNPPDPRGSPMEMLVCLLPITLILMVLGFLPPRGGRSFGLIRSVWQDWTRLTFGLYVLLIFYPLPMLEDLNGDLRLRFYLLTQGMVLLGAYFYLRWHDRRAQALALWGCTVLAVLIVAVGSEIYWQRYQFVAGTGVLDPANLPLNTAEALRTGWDQLIRIMPALIAPGLIGLLRWAMGVVKAARRGAAST